MRSLRMFVPATFGAAAASLVVGLALFSSGCGYSVMAACNGNCIATEEKGCDMMESDCSTERPSSDGKDCAYTPLFTGPLEQRIANGCSGCEG